MDIQFLVERLESLVVNARKVPMTSQVILEQAAILDVIDQLRVAIPEEVRQARRINQESDRVLSRRAKKRSRSSAPPRNRRRSSCRTSRSCGRPR